MSAVWMRLRAELRQRWRGWVALAVLVGAFGGAVVAAAGGAVRTDSVVDRHVAKQKPPDIFLAPAFVTAGADDPRALQKALSFENLRRLPSVLEGAHAFILPTEGGEDESEILASDDPRVGHSLFAPKLVEGRHADPSRIDEATVNVLAAERLGLRVGSRYTVKFLRGFPGVTIGPDEAATGPVVTFRITGVEAFLGDFSAIAGSSLSATPAFLNRYGDEIRGIELSMLRLRRGGASYEEFDRDVQKLSGGQSVLYVRSAAWEEARRSFGLQAVALWILAGILALVTVLVIGQTIARQTFLESSDHPVLLALGLTRRRLFALGILRAALIGALGAATAILIAALASPFTPFGNARLADPEAGFSAPAATLTLGFLGVWLGVVALAAVPSWRGARTAAGGVGTAELPSSAEAAGVVETLTRVARGPAAGVGVRMALQRGHGRTAVPVRTTMAAIVISVMALTAALVVGSSLERLTKTPHLYGWNWDVIVSTEEESDIVGELQGFATPEAQAALTGIPGVAAATFAPIGGSILLNGVSMEPYGLPLSAQVHPPILEGRAPEAADEIAVARKSLRAMHAGIGDVAQLRFPGTEAQGNFRIVGVTVLPIVRSDISTVGEGAWVPLEGVARLFGGQVPMDGALVRFAPGVDPTKVTKAIEAKFGPGSVQQAVAPATVVDFGRVSNMPYVLAAIVGILAAGTLAHGLVTAVRRRRRDLAVLKTLGLDPGQVRQAVSWQATVTALVSLIVGIPMGVVVGRWMWMVFANEAGVVPEPVAPLGALGITVLAAIALANVIAAGPARSAARTQPALILRSE
jgi:ABC-type lipoprotein release transport system permease subunit